MDSKLSSKDEAFGFRSRGQGSKHCDYSHANASGNAHFDIQIVLDKNIEIGSTGMADVDGRTSWVCVLVSATNCRGNID